MHLRTALVKLYANQIEITEIIAWTQDGWYTLIGYHNFKTLSNMIEIVQSSTIGSPAPPIHPWDRIPCQQQTYAGFRILYIGKLKQCFSEH